MEKTSLALKKEYSEEMRNERQQNALDNQAKQEAMRLASESDKAKSIKGAVSEATKILQQFNDLKYFALEDELRDTKQEVNTMKGQVTKLINSEAMLEEMLRLSIMDNRQKIMDQRDKFVEYFANRLVHMKGRESCLVVFERFRSIREQAHVARALEDIDEALTKVMTCMWNNRRVRVHFRRWLMEVHTSLFHVEKCRMAVEHYLDRLGNVFITKLKKAMRLMRRKRDDAERHWYKQLCGPIFKAWQYCESEAKERLMLNSAQLKKMDDTRDNLMIEMQGKTDHHYYKWGFEAFKLNLQEACEDRAYMDGMAEVQEQADIIWAQIAKRHNRRKMLWKAWKSWFFVVEDLRQQDTLFQHVTESLHRLRFRHLFRKWAELITMSRLLMCEAEVWMRRYRLRDAFMAFKLPLEVAREGAMKESVRRVSTNDAFRLQEVPQLYEVVLRKYWDWWVDFIAGADVFGARAILDKRVTRFGLCDLLEEKPKSKSKSGAGEGKTDGNESDGSSSSSSSSDEEMLTGRISRATPNTENIIVQRSTITNEERLRMQAKKDQEISQLQVIYETNVTKAREAVELEEHGSVQDKAQALAALELEMKEMSKKMEYQQQLVKKKHEEEMVRAVTENKAAVNVGTVSALKYAFAQDSEERDLALIRGAFQAMRRSVLMASKDRENAMQAELRALRDKNRADEEERERLKDELQKAKAVEAIANDFAETSPMNSTEPPPPAKAQKKRDSTITGGTMQMLKYVFVKAEKQPGVLLRVAFNAFAENLRLMRGVKSVLSVLSSGSLRDRLLLWYLTMKRASMARNFFRSLFTGKAFKAWHKAAQASIVNSLKEKIQTLQLQLEQNKGTVTVASEKVVEERVVEVEVLRGPTQDEVQAMGPVLEGPRVGEDPVLD
ncbi:hypothetical protein CYMTET_49058 [Cymbomonas tetramitiformis]|uniref:Uncharacterized protein n=1 Tax=Cymbomonas tetramitiformis TaxID=36881 RepID=A0AAE0BS21_9CHLO|nr:hypothetical protein CYMTET_49058 [Cymbomonas tetramitiformis]